jgi:hypothetical protein
VQQLGDQTAAGALMWFWVTVAYLIPAGGHDPNHLSRENMEA